ncbi:hypothetical protein [Methylobacterium sp. OT2]|uniref:hypothetical protein n=1 Tax=Methylobacterium sp. OT2 TaxID=2813779 RepID=UPI00197C4CFD|nr:hypothetical protein [Methylobacterium sp. OT2]MBN4098573.1 hypothetical protein [Methylobacterium sp. OT2]
MWFKLTYSLHGMHVNRQDRLPISIQVDADRLLTFWMREIMHEGKLNRTLCCDAIIEKEPPAKVASTLRNLLNNVLTLDSPPQKGLPYQTFDTVIVDEAGKVAPNWSLPLSLMPRAVRNYQPALQQTLADLIRNYVKNWRWRYNSWGPHSPFAHVSFDWSDDKDIWHPMPFDYGIGSAISLTGLNTDLDIMNEVAQFIAGRVYEPFPHELRREAADLVQGRPRSALLVAVTALETGIKHYIAQLAPDTRSLLEKMPSPPAVTLIQEIIPALHKARLIETDLFPLDGDAEKYLKKWISQRNQVAHGVKKTVKSEELTDFIVFVTNILYAFDHLTGHAWALERVQSDPRVPPR